MPVITAIVASPKQAGRYEVEVNGKRFAVVSVDIIDRLRLRVGAELSAEAAATLEHDAQALRTYDRALNMLAFRARSSAELRRQLLRKGEPEQFVDAAVQRLDAVGLLDDGEYARQYARSKVVGAGFSRRRLQHELRKRGVAREVAERAIGDVFEDETVDEEALIQDAARKKLKTLAKLDPETRRRRLYAFLARRGYEPDDVRRAMARVLGEKGRGEE